MCKKVDKQKALIRFCIAAKHNSICLKITCEPDLRGEMDPHPWPSSCLLLLSDYKWKISVLQQNLTGDINTFKARPYAQ